MNIAVVPEVEAVMDEATATIEALDAKAWERTCEAECWSVAVTALHIALGLRRQASFIALARDGKAPFVFDWEATHALNARVAARGVPTKEAVRRELRVAVTYQGHEFDVERIVRRIVLPHTRGHLASIRAAARGSV